eukprot:1796594-Pleurochrysis_carterae.AAC.1
MLRQCETLDAMANHASNANLWTLAPHLALASAGGEENTNALRHARRRCMSAHAACLNPATQKTSAKPAAQASKALRPSPRPGTKFASSTCRPCTLSTSQAATADS